MGVQSEESLYQAYKLIESCSVREAVEILNSALLEDLGNESLVFAIQACNFWQEVFVGLNSIDKNNFFEKGESLLNSWKTFLKMYDYSDNIASFGSKSLKAKSLSKKSTEKSADLASLVAEDRNLSDDSENSIFAGNFANSETVQDAKQEERTLYAFKKGIFSLALDYFSKVQDESDSKLNAKLCRKKGLCYKKLGSYEIALELLMKANSNLPGLSFIMAEMADCYALCGETRYAKLLFKEAFFVDPQKIDLSYLESPLISELEEKVMEKGFSDQMLLEWMAVWGVLYKTFNVKRKLRSQEVFQLQQDIFAKESELKERSNNRALIVPRLINLYFWLIDYYLLSKENLTKVTEVLLKIKILDPTVYSIYVGEN